MFSLLHVFLHGVRFFCCVIFLFCMLVRFAKKYFKICSFSIMTNLKMNSIRQNNSAAHTWKNIAYTSLVLIREICIACYFCMSLYVHIRRLFFFLVVFFFTSRLWHLNAGIFRTVGIIYCTLPFDIYPPRFKNVLVCDLFFPIVIFPLLFCRLLLVFVVVIIHVTP